jgi:hypothetical protein
VLIVRVRVRVRLRTNDALSATIVIHNTTVETDATDGAGGHSAIDDVDTDATVELSATVVINNTVTAAAASAADTTHVEAARSSEQ